jgi:hypothetical protein
VVVAVVVVVVLGVRPPVTCLLPRPELAVPEKPRRVRQRARLVYREAPSHELEFNTISITYMATDRTTGLTLSADAII